MIIAVTPVCADDAACDANTAGQVCVNDGTATAECGMWTRKLFIRVLGERIFIILQIT